MRLNSVFILAVAILMGGIAAFLARNWLVSRTQQPATTTTIVAAAKELPFGTPLTDDSVQEMPWAAKVTPAGSFTSKQALFKDGSRVALATIQQNEPILSSKITGPNQRASLSTLLDKDKRAITIRVDDVRGVAGFILPNDRVDIVLIRAESDSAGHRQSEILLQDLKVIAVDQLSSERKKEKDSAVVAKAVTLEVTPLQAQKISLATNVGSLSLILRKAGDADVVANRRVTETDLGENEVRASPVAPQPAKIQPAPAPSGTTVTIIRNLRNQEYRVMEDHEGAALSRR